MNYLVTGATGFIGRFLVGRLLQREDAQVHVLVRKSSKAKFEALQRRAGEAGERLHAVYGDIAREGVIPAAERKKLAGKIDHLFHLAAVYDMNMDDRTGDAVNNEGTRNVVKLANALGGDIRLHHVSSVAVAGGSFDGRFTEDMFDQGQDLAHPYFRTKFESEKIVREGAKVPFRIYRPGAVVGSSETGEMDKVDGPYYFFKTIQKIRDTVPKWLPLLGVEGGKVPVAPVDYVAAAMDTIAHKDGLDGGCFHLIQSNSPTVGELLAIFFEAAHGPELAAKLDLSFDLPKAVQGVTRAISRQIPRGVERSVSRAIGVPVSVLGYVNNRAVFDDKRARAALRGSGIKCPDLRDYAEKLWQYWELHLDLHVKIPRDATRKLGGKVVMITGASSGIGFMTAKKVAATGAKVILVARTREKLEDVQRILEKAGGEAHVYPCDLSDLEAIDAMADQVLHDFGHVDVLINNAGRSIRRAVIESLDRFHDFERTMQLNYLAPVRLTMRLLPGMLERGSGHLVNVSSQSAMMPTPRFAAYVASKSALEGFSRSIAAELRDDGVTVTIINYPLVRTPMTAPTKLYRKLPMMGADEAADWMLRAVRDRPARVSDPRGFAFQMAMAAAPGPTARFTGWFFDRMVRKLSS